jgi:signal transduction histidine kinase
VKHTAPKDSITLSARCWDGVVVIAVADSGTGIPTEHFARLFDRFARSDPGRSREGGGIGLGLSIVKSVAEAHGGSVRVESTLGQGSVFEIRLPLAPASSQPTDHRLELERPGSRERGPGA